MDRFVDMGRRGVWLGCVARLMIGVLGVTAAADAASGWTAYVTENGANVVTRISTESNVTFGTAIPVGADAEGSRSRPMAAPLTSPTPAVTR
jgi:hypothetical protein